MTAPDSRSVALLVDVGNSRVKWRWRNGGHQQGACPISDLVKGVPPSWAKTAHPDRVVVSLVARRSLRDEMKNWIAEHWSVEPEFPDGATPFPGMRNRYADPRQLGVDRWLALIGAREPGSGPVVVVDCGTAMTADLVDAAGDFLGGMIMPGREILESAFKERVPYLGTDGAGAFEFPANNTADAIALGIHFAVVASLDRFVENAARLAGAAPAIHVTGGDARWLCGQWDARVTRHQNLVLDGLDKLLEIAS